jgi:hypothetical protein
MAAAPYLYKKLPFDPIKDFTPVTTLDQRAAVVAYAAVYALRTPKSIP